tara:strand:- start:298 stop:480 length:183 start_codon:yes stop_codon:yes gene_type:complete
MIIFTVLGIITAITFLFICVMAILEAKAKRVTKEKLLRDMEKIDSLTDDELIEEIQSNER